MPSSSSLFYSNEPSQFTRSFGANPFLPLYPFTLKLLYEFFHPYRQQHDNKHAISCSSRNALNDFTGSAFSAFQRKSSLKSLFEKHFLLPCHSTYNSYNLRYTFNPTSTYVFSHILTNTTERRPN